MECHGLQWSAARHAEGCKARNCRLFQLSAAREAEGRKDWFAAVILLRHLLQAEPDNTELKSRLQTAREQLKK